MPIKIPDALPATDVLEGENIFVMTEFRAMHQDIRPLKVLLLNLMPTKIVTETQIMRKLSNTPLQIEVSLLQTASHESKNVSEQHLETFYTTFDEIKGQRFDGMIITGAPVELLDFEDVDYWDELAEIMAWSATNVHSTLHIWSSLPCPTRRAFTWPRAPTAVTSSYSGIRNTTPERSWWSTSATSRRAWTCPCRATISRATILRRSPAPPGAPTRSCSTRTG